MSSIYLNIVYKLYKRGILKSLNYVNPALLKTNIYITESVCAQNEKLFSSYGVSIESKNISLSKCTGETIERMFLNNQRKQQVSSDDRTGSGLATGTKKEEILLRAIYELVERDAFMLCFLTKFLPKRLDEKSVWKHLGYPKVENYFKKYAFYFFDITNDVSIPSFAVFMTYGSRKKTIISAGIKSNINPLKAILGALEESILEMVLKQSKKIKQAENNLLILSYKEWKKHFFHEKKKYVFTKKTQKSLSNRDELRAVSKKLDALHMNYFYTDVSPELCDKTLYRLYKVMIPSLQHLFFYKNRDKINKSRIKQINRYLRQASPQNG